MPDSMGWAAVFVGRRIAVGMWRRADRDANARAYTGHQYPYADIGPANASADAGAGWRGIQLIGWPDVGNGVKLFGQSWTRPAMLMPLIRSCP